MNHAERARQEHLLELEREKQLRRLQQQREKALQTTWSKKTGSFLTKTVLPYLKKSKAVAAQNGEKGKGELAQGDMDTTTTEPVEQDQDSSVAVGTESELVAADTEAR